MGVQRSAERMTGGHNVIAALERLARVSMDLSETSTMPEVLLGDGACAEAGVSRNESKCIRNVSTISESVKRTSTEVFAAKQDRSATPAFPGTVDGAAANGEVQPPIAVSESDSKRCRVHDFLRA